MRLTRKIQEQADKLAKEYSGFCAVYYGKIDSNTFVFHIEDSDSREKCTGFPQLLVCEDGQFRHVYSFESLDIINKTKRYYSRKGWIILHQYEKIEDENYIGCTENERSYIRSILQWRFPSYDTPIDMNVLYKYLEIAERLHMYLDFVPTEESYQRCDGWEYYIQLVENMPDKSAESDY